MIAGSPNCNVDPSKAAACISPDGMGALVAMLESLTAWHRRALIQCAATGPEL